MINTVILLLTLIIATFQAFFIHRKTDKAQIIDLYFLYFLVASVGIIGALGFISHVFFSYKTAELIGWPPGNPFQFEVGVHDGAWALLGFLCIFYRGNFWTATALGWSFFMLGAAFGHIKQAVVMGNFAPYNVGTILPDLLVPIILLTLLLLRSRYSKS